MRPQILGWYACSQLSESSLWTSVAQNSGFHCGQDFRDVQSSPRRYNCTNEAPSHSHFSRISYRYVFGPILRAQIRLSCLRPCGLHIGVRTRVPCISADMCTRHYTLMYDVHSRVLNYNRGVNMHDLDCGDPCGPCKTFVGSITTL